MTLICGGSTGRIWLSAVFVGSILLYVFWPREATGAVPNLPAFPFKQASSHVEESSYIWQIRFSPDAKSTERREAWVNMNPGHEYVFLDRAKGDELVADDFAHRPDIREVWRDLGSPILRSDYLRYLALAAKGGVYADLDAVPKKPVDEWIPAEFRGRAHAAIGLEFDQLDATDPADHGSMEWNGMDWPVQFCQWTILSWAAHPLLQAMVDQVTDELRLLADQHRTTIQKMEPTDSEVTRTTGPSAWTRLVMKELSRTSGHEISWKNFTGMKEPRLFGDVLILPINAYAAGQEHSGSVRNAEVPDALVRHLFEGFWKHGWNN